MPFPKNAEELRRHGYRFAGHDECSGCHQRIEWWISPQGRHIPMNRMPDADTAAQSHWATCLDSGLFDRPKTTPQTHTELRVPQKKAS
jgi:hypothetical protein